MSEGDNVISLGTRKPLEQERQEREEAVKGMEERAAKSESDTKDTMIHMLKQAIKLVESDQLDGLVILGQNPKNQLFFSEIVMNPTLAKATTCYAYAGALEAAKNEMLDDAIAGPHMDSEGEFFGLLSQDDVGDAEFILRDILKGDDDDDL